MVAEDAGLVLQIFADGIATGHATFRAAPPTWEEFDAGHLAAPRLVAEHGGVVAGWAALTPVSGACAYTGVAEVSVYVAADARGRGVGQSLLTALVLETEAAGIWTLQASAFPENRNSLALARPRGLSHRRSRRTHRVDDLRTLRGPLARHPAS